MNHPDPLNPYIGLFNFRSIRAICSKNSDVNVVSPRPIAPPVGPYSEFNTMPGKYSYGTHTVHYPRFAYLLPQKIFKYTLSSRAISRMLPEFISNNFRKPDICHAGHIHYDGYGLLPFCKEEGIPLTVMGRGKILNNYHELSFIARRKVYETLDYADQILCVSGSLARIAEDIVGEAKVTVLANGADPSRYPTSCKDQIREELDIPPEMTVLLFCGGYTERKGIYEIADALDEIHHEDVHLVFIGHYGNLRNHLIDSLAESPHESYEVLWKVPPLALRRWFAIADIFMLPSHAEGRPNTVYEAMASETAVVGSAISGIPEQVVDGETGILIPSKDTSALASAINKLICTPGMREQMGKRGEQRLIEEGWTWESHGKKLNNIHKTIVDQA